MSLPLGVQGLIDGLLEAVLLVDGISLRIDAVNATAARMLDLPGEALVGRPVIEFAVTPEDMYFWEDVAAGQSTHILSETLVRRADGSSVRVDRRVAPVEHDGRVFFIVCLRDQSKHRQTEDALERLLAEMRATLESTADGILVVGLDGQIRSYNQRFADLWELPWEMHTRRDDQAVHRWLLDHVAAPDAYQARLEELARQPLAEGHDVVRLRSGRVLERAATPQLARGRAVGRVYSFRDITQRLHDEARLRLAAKVFAASLDAVLILDGAFGVVAANPRAQDMAGVDEIRLVNKPLAELLYHPDDENFAARLCRKVGEAGLWEGDAWLRQADGEGMPGLASIVRLADEGEAPRHVLFFKDQTEKLEANRRIEQLAYSDALTGLPNRTLLGERLGFALEWARREQRPFAILFIDLDRFKEINDSLGHDFGDRVLVEVSRRFASCLRNADTAARLGGDEFLILLHDVNERSAELMAERILDTLAAPFTFEDVSFSVTCSIGIALYPGDGESADELVKNADTAMYRVKERGRAGFRFYQKQMNVDLLARMKMDHAMRLALPAGEFRLYYQPQVDIATNAVIGAEALIRWHHAEMGMVPPDRFIPLAEESGFIIAIGDWVMREAVSQAAAWHRAGFTLPVSVNVSALQFQQANFVESVAKLLADHGLPADQLELELTESILLQGVDGAIPRLQALAQLGVRLSIDDFGAGYSSLAYLKRFPIHKLKIDRSFVKGLPDDEDDCAIAVAIIRLGQALRLQIIAEGVETAAQRDFLAAQECNQFQGFLESPALPAEAFRKFVEQRANNS